MPPRFINLPVELQDPILDLVFEHELISQVDAYASARNWSITMLATRSLRWRRLSSAIDIAQFDSHWLDILTKTLEELVPRVGAEYGEGWERWTEKPEIWLGRYTEHDLGFESLLFDSVSRRQICRILVLDLLRKDEIPKWPAHMSRVIRRRPVGHPYNHGLRGGSEED